jgi:DNA-binding transcriptional LysR family regulator
MQLQNMDVNLLVVLHALLETRSVSAAAARIHLSESATSHALARLRELLDDAVLVRSGRSLVPTARALEMMGALSQGVAAFDSALRAGTEFNPKTVARRFRIVAGDYTSLLLVPPLLRRLSSQAPNIDLWIENADPSSAIERVVRGDADLCIGVASSADARVEQQVLLRDTFVSMVRKRHPVLRGRMTVSRFAAMAHAFVAPGGKPGGPVDDALAAHNLRRRVAVAVPHFLVAPHIVAQSDLVLTLGAHLAKELGRTLPVVTFRPPLPLPGFALSAMWHARSTDDRAHRFLRQQLQEAAQPFLLPVARARSKKT